MPSGPPNELHVSRYGATTHQQCCHALLSKGTLFGVSATTPKIHTYLKMKAISATNASSFLQPAIITQLGASSTCTLLSLQSNSIRNPNCRPGPSYASISSPNPRLRVRAMASWLEKLGLGRARAGALGAQADAAGMSIAQGPDDDVPGPGQQFAQFGAGCFWGVELAFQRVPGVTKTEVGYSQGVIDKPTYNDVCSGATGHNEVVRVQYDPKECSYEDLLACFWARHDPTTVNRQGNDVGTQYRSGIYFYSPEQEKAGLESKEKHEQKLNRQIVTEILPAKKFYRAEEYHQQYLAKGGRFGLKQSTEKGCNDPIRCYG